MLYKINQQEFNGVVALPAKERYGHFIKRIADWEEVWEKYKCQEKYKGEV